MQFLKENEFILEKISIDDIMLDPNNPRFLEMDFDLEPVPDNRISEEKIQKETMRKMMQDAFDVASLRDSILAIGFLPIDKIVVRPIKDDKYVVIEGNRRLAALKSILLSNEIGKITLEPYQLENFSKLEVYVIKDTNNIASYQMLIPGVRHISGIKSWGAYQKAVLVNKLLQQGNSDNDIGAMLGLGKRTITITKYAFYLFETAKSLETFEIKANHYSYFEEVAKSPVIRQWLKFNDVACKCDNLVNLELFVSWMFGQVDGATGIMGKPKLPEALTVRELTKIIQNSDQTYFQLFLNTNKGVEEIVWKLRSDTPTDGWQSAIDILYKELNNISLITIQNFNEDDFNKLENIKNYIESTIHKIRTIKDS